MGFQSVVWDPQAACKVFLGACHHFWRRGTCHHPQLEFPSLVPFYMHAILSLLVPPQDYLSLLTPLGLLGTQDPLAVHFLFPHSGSFFFALVAGWWGGGPEWEVGLSNSPCELGWPQLGKIKGEEAAAGWRGRGRNVGGGEEKAATPS